MSPPPLPLTRAQEGIWIGQMLDVHSAAYVTAESVELRGPIELNALRDAVTEALHEVEGLRAFIDVRTQRPALQLDAAQSLAPRCLEVRDLAAASAWMKHDIGKPFDLEAGPLSRQSLLSISASHVVWYVAAHHLALDGYAFSLLIQRAGELYGARVAGKPPAASTFSAQADVARDDAAYEASAQHTQDAVFWRARLAGMPSPASLCRSLPGRACLPRRLERQLDTATLAALDQYAHGRGPSWMHTLTALFAAFVQTHGEQTEAVLGLPVLARVGSVALRAPSMMMNIVPLRLASKPGQGLRGCAEAVARELGDVLPHSRYRYEQLRRDLRLLGEGRRLFGPVLNVMPFARAPRFGALEGKVQSISAGPVEDLSLSVHPLPARSGLQLTFDVHPEAYSLETATRWVELFLDFVHEAVALPERALVSMPHRVERVLHGEPLLAPAEDVLACIVAQAAHAGDRTAVEQADRRVSYRELLSRAAVLADVLAAHNIGEGVLVALLLPRSVEAIVAMLAVLMRGAAYVPLDPTGPAERTAAILADARPQLLLVHEEYEHRRSSAELAVVVLGSEDPGVVHAAAAGVNSQTADFSASTPAYVIYTSGSTGVPNGVVVGRGALSHFVAAARQTYGFTAQERVLQFAPLAFDASVEEIFVTLASGARLVLRDDDMVASATRFLARSAALSLTVLDLPTAFFHELAYALARGELMLPASVHTVIIGGETARRERVAEFVAHTRGRVRLLNTYGPTESTVVATCVDLSVLPSAPLEAALPIGRPLPGTSAILQARAGEPDTYELSLSGPSLALGYLHRPELSARRFAELDSSGRAYRTGDLVRLDAADQLCFVGRDDDQLKLSGQRVELAEVERVLSAHPDVHAVVVVVSASGLQRSLVAHVVPAREDLPLASLRAHASAHLLPAAVPATFVLHRTLPLTATGKVDRARLRETPMPEPVAHEDAPMTALERMVLEVYREVLGKHALGLEEDFFELGGQSLQTIQVATRLSLRLGREVAGALLFQRPTVRLLAAALSADSTAPTVDRAAEVDALLLADTALDEAAFSLGARRDYNDGEVLLTGATGFLGVHILRALLQERDRRVVCLVRADDEVSARERLRAALRAQKLDSDLPDTRVRVLVGDLSKPRLGVSDEAYRELQCQVGRIVHNGASVSLARGYASLRATNVHSTRALLELARGTPHTPAMSLHYISTLASALGADASGSLPERFVPHHAGLQDGYSQSKWASERLLDQARAYGLRVQVLRLGRLVGALETAHVNRDDLIWRLLAAGVRVGMLPRLQVQEPWTPVDVVARVIVRAMFDEAAHQSVFHLAPDTMLSLDDVMHWTSSYGYQLPLRPPAEFLAQLRAGRADVDPTTLAMLEAQAEHRMPAISRLEVSATRALMERAGWTWPTLGRPQLHRYLARCVESGLLPAPPRGTSPSLAVESFTSAPVRS